MQVIGTDADPLAQLRAMRGWCSAMPTTRGWEVVTMPYIASDTLPKATSNLTKGIPAADDGLSPSLIVGIVVLGIAVVLTCTWGMWLCLRDRHSKAKTGGYAQCGYKGTL